MVGTQIFFIFSPKIGEDEPNLTHIFQRGWNHQPDDIFDYFGVEMEGVIESGICVLFVLFISSLNGHRKNGKYQNRLKQKMDGLARGGVLVDGLALQQFCRTWNAQVLSYFFRQHLPLKPATRLPNKNRATNSDFQVGFCCEMFQQCLVHPNRGSPSLEEISNGDFQEVVRKNTILVDASYH